MPQACFVSRSNRPQQAPSCTASPRKACRYRRFAEAIGRNLDLPVEPVAPEDAEEHFGWPASFAALDIRASSELTGERLGYLDKGHTAARRPPATRGDEIRVT